MNSRTHAQRLARALDRAADRAIERTAGRAAWPCPGAPSAGLALVPWLAAPALEGASAWAWPAATAAAAALAFAAFLRSRTLARRADELAAERREAEAVASAHEKELERVSTALRLEIATLTRALANERKLFDAGPVTRFRWRAAAGWPVEYASPNVVQLFGWTAQEFMDGRVRYAEVVHAADLERVVAEVTEHSARGATYFEQDYRVRDKQGVTRWLYDITIVERDATGTITHYVGYVLDRTERQHADEQRRDLEERLQQAQRLESLGVLAGGIAHDFNNLLVGILGNASLARERMQCTDANRELVDSIEQAARHAGDLTHQMLAYAGKAYVAYQLVDLNSVIAELTGLLRASVSKKAKFELRVSSVAPRIVGDAAQLDQVVMNLVTNASDALADGPGTIVLATGETDLSPADLAELYGAPNLGPGRYAYVEVVDDGCGMDAATRARMFEPFFTTKFAGRGLGLAAVLGIARGHRGGIAVDSSPGVGTRVRVYVPVAAADSPVTAARPREVPISELPRTTVLVVDDEPAVQKLAARVVRGHGLQVLVASDGEQALDLHARYGAEIGCVLLDLTMPKLSGAETFKVLRERSPGLPIVVTSGYSESDALEQLDAKNGTLFLQKPFTPADLVARLAAALGEA